jgi:hypothetical protein
MDGFTDRIYQSVFSKELGKNYCLCHNHQCQYFVGDLPMVMQTESIRRYISESLRKITSYATITNKNMLMGYFRQHISSEKKIFGVYFLFVKLSGFFLLTELTINVEINNK